MAVLPPPPMRAPLYFAELHIVASFVHNDRLTYLSVLGWSIPIQPRFCSNMEFPSFFDNSHFFLISLVEIEDLISIKDFPQVLANTIWIQRFTITNYDRNS